MRYMWRLLSISLLMATPALAQNQINPATQIRWPVPCVGVYQPTGNTCVPTGTAANPAGISGDQQFNVGGIFGVDAGGTQISRATYNFTLHQQQIFDQSLQRPRIDVRNPVYGADPTCTNDSYPALLAAYNDATSSSRNPFATPVIYMPAGCYTLSQELRITKPLEIDGDGNDSTVIKHPAGYHNIFTLVSPSGPTSFKHMQIVGNGAQMGSGTGDSGSVFEFNFASDITVDDILVVNWGGRVINNFGDSERGNVHNLRISSAAIGIDSGTQSNEWNYGDIVAWNLGRDFSNHCYHPGINCSTSTFLITPANSDTCANYPAWAASTKYQRGQSICDTNGNIETVSAEGTSNTAAPTWATAEYGTTCDGTSAQCTASPIPYYIPDYSGPVQWTNRKLDTPWLIDHIPFIRLGGNRVHFHDATIKPTAYTAGISVGASQAMLDSIYLEGYPFNNEPRVTPGIIVGPGEVTSTFSTSTIPAAATSFTVKSAQFMFETVLTLDSDASTHTGQTHTIYLACPDGDPTQTTGNCTTAGFTSFAKNQVEVITVYAFSLQSNTGYIASRCQSGSSSGCGSGFAWPTGTLVMDLGAAGGSPTGATAVITNIHNSSNDTPGNTGFWPIASMTTHTQLADGSWISNTPGSVIAGPTPDGRMYTAPGAARAGWAGNGQSQAGRLYDFYDYASSGYVPYVNQNGVSVPVWGTVFDYSDRATSGISLPNGNYAGWTLGQYGAPFIQFGFYNNNFAHGNYYRPPSGITMIPGTVNNLNFVRNVVPGDAGFSQAGLVSAGGYCLNDAPPFGSTSTQPLNRLCLFGNPNTTVTQGFEYDTWSGSAWVNQFGVNSSGQFTGNLATSIVTTGMANSWQVSQNINGVSAGLMTNYAAQSSNLSVWNTAVGTTPTYTSGQADPWNGTTATRVVATGATNIYSGSGTALTASTNYIVCVNAKGALGTETIRPSAAGLGGQTFTLTTSFATYCNQVQTAATNLNRDAALDLIAGTYTIAAVWTVPGGNGSNSIYNGTTAYLPTTTASVTTPTPAVVAGSTVMPLTIPPIPPFNLTGTTTSIGGSAIGAGACATGTASVTGATTSMVAAASPNTYPGAPFSWQAQVTAANTVTVYVCTQLAAGGTPTAGTYNVRVMP